METRVPPNDLESERIVLRTLLRQSKKIFDFPWLRPGHFYFGFHRKAFAAMQTLTQRGDQVDVVTVADLIHGEEHTAAKINDITSAPAKMDFKYHVTRIAELHIRRKMLFAAQDLANKVQDLSEDVDDLMETAHRSILEACQSETKGDIYTIGQLHKMALDEIDEIMQGKESRMVMPTGFSAIDELLIGLRKSDMMVIAARPGMGKSALSMNIAYNLAKQGHPALFLSLEMSRSQVGRRSLCGEALINCHRIDSRKVKPGDWKTMTDACARSSDLPLYVIEAGRMSMPQLTAKVREVHARYGIKACFVDHLGFIKLESGNESTARKVGYATKGLKGLGKELDIHMGVLCQLSRDSVKGRGRRPDLSDLRDSGEIEQDADIVAFIHREDYKNENSDKKGIAEFIVRKNRNGPSPKTVKIQWQASITKFRDLDTHHDNDIPYKTMEGNSDN
jgi:replicative DNA helicase